MAVKNGTLEFDQRKYSIDSHFQCSDHGQSGHASNATLIHDKMKEVYGITHIYLTYPLLAYWVHPETGQEIAKGRVHEQSRWMQNAEPGHIFRFYWDLPGVPVGSHAEKGLLAQEINVGQASGIVVLQPNPEWETLVQNHGQYPLLVYWVHHKTGKEIAKGRIGMNENWNQNAKLGHVSLHAMMCLWRHFFAHCHCFIATSFGLGLPVLLGSS
jgi:hypothetical protein